MVDTFEFELIAFVYLCVVASLVAMHLVNGDFIVWELVIRSGNLDLRNRLGCVDRDSCRFIKQLGFRDFLNVVFIYRRFPRTPNSRPGASTTKFVNLANTGEPIFWLAFVRQGVADG